MSLYRLSLSQLIRGQESRPEDAADRKWLLAELEAAQREHPLALGRGDGANH
jgi:hypothetical protein